MAKFKKKFVLILLGIIICSSIFLRLYRLDQLEVFGDEIDVGYQAYSLLKTGRGYLGQLWPIYIHSLAEWRAPLLIYLTIPFVALFGLNEWGVRLPAVTFGVLGIILVYLLIKKLFANERWAILAAFLLAINPWNLHYSRAAFEVTLLLVLILAGLYLFLKGLINSWFLIPAAILFGLTFYTYNTANVFVPLFLVVLIVIYRQELLKWKRNRALWLSLAIFLIIIAPITKEFLFGQAAGRFGLISVFSDQKIIEEIHLRRLGGISFEKPAGKINFLERIFTNRPIYWTIAVSQNYLSSFSPEFIFAGGDSYFRHSVGKVGEFYLIEVILVVLGTFSLIKLKNKSKWIIFSWLLLSPVPSALTQGGGNHATRLFLMVFPLVVLSAFGLVQLFKLAKKKKIVILLPLFVCGLLFFNFSFYLYRYFVHYPRESWRYWHYGYKEAMKFVSEHQNEYDRILINNTHEPALLRYLFWTKYDPKEFQGKFTGDQTRENILPGFDGFNLGNVYFGTLSKGHNFKELINPDVLWMISQKEEVGGDWDWQESSPSEIKLLKTVRSPLGEAIFYLVSGK